ncbi:nyctalopin-like [Strigops habroptila]|uniref:nyctalopin-like n=1 Tax=Strigops habroptila TaxID=2489341 RepID=UPI0011CFA14F|nr:nyctalopin-like [Strigops habroptila]
MFFPVIFLLTRAAEAGLSLNLSASCPSMCKCAPEEIIHCNRTGLRALPGEIATSTISLNLSNNYLRVLSTNTFRNLTFLHSLWLDGNNLTFLSPGTFHALSQLRELHLSRNSRLTYLHANTFRGLLNLISLDLSHCNIFEIHPLLFSHLPSLERLDLASNNMRYVPQAFRNLSSLTKLSLEGNHIEAIGRDSLKDVESLYELNLRKNRIWIIQNGAFTKLLRLGMLNLGHNFIADLPNQLFDGLTQLKTIHLEANRITAVACTFRHLLNLRNLYLNNNQISSISDSAFLYLNKLHFLHLSKNNLSSLPSHLLAELPKLKYVFLSHNPWKCDCRMLWFWRWTATRGGAIQGLHCAFPGPHNTTEPHGPRPGDLTHCMVPPELPSEDKCKLDGTSAATRLHTVHSGVILLVLTCQAWCCARGWGTSA